MNTRTIVLGWMALLCLVMTGCAAQGLARDNAVRNDSIIGTWKNTVGDVYTVRHGSGSSYIAEGTLADGTRNTLDIDLIEVNEQTIVQIPLGMGADGAPLYHFGLLAITSESIQHRPLNEQWLNEQTGSDNGLAVFNDPAHLRALLQRAIEDRAFGATETLKRVR